MLFYQRGESLVEFALQICIRGSGGKVLHLGRIALAVDEHPHFCIACGAFSMSDDIVRALETPQTRINSSRSQTTDDGRFDGQASLPHFLARLSGL